MLSCSYDLPDVRRTTMRWMKNNDSIEIEAAVSLDLKCAVWVVKSNLEFKDLPIAFRSKFRKQITSNQRSW